MSWSTNHVVPERKTGRSWSSNPTVPSSKYRSGWFALLEKVGAHNGSGNLALKIAPLYAIHVGFSGDGKLLSDLVIRRYLTALLSGTGNISAIQHQLKTLGAVSFSGNGQVFAELNDGLSAIIKAGYAVRFTSEGSLVLNILGGEELPEDLSAKVKALLSQATGGTGTVSAAFMQRYMLSANLSGGGKLDAEFVSAEVIDGLSARVSAIIIQHGTADPAFSGSGTLSATAVPVETSTGTYPSTSIFPSNTLYPKEI